MTKRDYLTASILREAAKQALDISAPGAGNWCRSRQA